jgi:hypothetical protein
VQGPTKEALDASVSYKYCIGYYIKKKGPIKLAMDARGDVRAALTYSGYNIGYLKGPHDLEQTSRLGKEGRMEDRGCRVAYRPMVMIKMQRGQSDE